jgi:CheY-like chemotaxis protein
MKITGEDAADVAYALQRFPSVRSIYVLPASDHPDAFALAIVLSPYGIDELVQAHYALVEATGGRALAGRVLYVDAAIHDVAALHSKWQRVSIGPMERQWAHARIEERKESAKLDDRIQDLKAMELAFRRIAEQAERDTPEAHPAAVGTPYRGALAVSFGATAVLEVVADPFPSPRKQRVLVVDDDPTTAKRIAALSDVDVIWLDDGWSAVDRLTKGDVDLAVCAVSIAGFSGAKIHKLVATANPRMARRIVYLATETAVSQAPPSSASGRLLARPISPEAVRSMLDTLGRVS